MTLHARPDWAEYENQLYSHTEATRLTSLCHYRDLVPSQSRPLAIQIIKHPIGHADTQGTEACLSFLFPRSINRPRGNISSDTTLAPHLGSSRGLQRHDAYILAQERKLTISIYRSLFLPLVATGPLEPLALMKAQKIMTDP